MTEFDQHVKDYLSAGEKLDSELQELTQLTVKAFEQMKIVMQFSKYLKKPQQDNIKQISSILNDKVFKPINSAKAGIKYPNHLKTVIQGISAVNWVICVSFLIYLYIILQLEFIQNNQLFRFNYIEFHEAYSLAQSLSQCHHLNYVTLHLKCNRLIQCQKQQVPAYRMLTKRFFNKSIRFVSLQIKI
ncbi:adenylyl cyclase-associated protein (macronuclear) [Tetrahymena thermophila SB210]|uniref:Adenylyl cyclase-associated protein n=1 Tax=Tetrahymena thermophila (strain SB210) TaxID=312017 RepID=Q23BN8_TETTS|nr:adenylyl cyclase-associated protein [Tetrahymena thermophila SB210]EAR94080.3 adenylyl cyclase-associated protein [Tetrahymena thermophila SB210]|eukprot:XP_001014325.3 adenylyl cyclase-associated protein [Tetrahymena thermophila SB210]